MSPLRHADPTLDHAVPSLDLVLDADRLGRWLASRGEVLLDRPYLRYKPGTSCVVALRLESGRAFLYGVSEPARPKLDKLVALAQPGSIRAVDHRLRLVLAAVAADRDLPALRDLPRAIARMGLNRSEGEPGSESSRPTVLVHKPQRRLVGLLGASPDTDPERWGNIVLRAYRRGHSDRAAERHRAAGRVDGVRTARILATSSRDALLALEHLPGQTLDALLATGAAGPDLLRATGRALAQVHAAPVDRVADRWPESTTATRTTVSAAAQETAALVGRLCPGLAGRLAAVLAELASSAPIGNEPVLCHGDFSADQVVVDGHRRPALIDWDRARVADPASDLASARAAGLSADQMAEVLEGYRRLRPVPRHLDWHLAQGHLMRVADPFRSAQEAWRDQIEANLCAAEATVSALRPDRR
jgi:aminoglycoside phosphotransferase (APT) family kinase protein